MIILKIFNAGLIKLIWEKLLREDRTRKKMKKMKVANIYDTVYAKCKVGEVEWYLS
jgi:hypothetical protein